MTTEKRYVYALDGENFIFESEEEVVEEAQEEGYSTYSKGVVKPILPHHLIDANDVIEMIGERAWDIAGEWADDFPDVTKEAKGELEQFLHQWVEKHCTPSFYLVEEVEEIEVPPKEA